MKKIMVLLFVLLGASFLTHASIPQETPKTGDQSATPVSPEDKGDGEKMGNGSGDDIDTIDEGDPANDKDPEADDTGTTPPASAK